MNTKMAYLIIWLLFWGATIGFSQVGDSLVLRLGSDLGCSGVGGELNLKQGTWSYGAEYFACEATPRVSVRVGYQPFFFIPVEFRAYLGTLSGFLSYGLDISAWWPLWDALPNQGQLGLAGSAGLGLTHLPLGGPLPGFRLVLALDYRQPIFLQTSSRGPAHLGENSSGPTDVSGCVAASPEGLMITFRQLVDSTRSAVVASIGAIYTDIYAELTDLEVTVEGINGRIQARYVAGATERSTGRRHTYSGLGIAYFRHNGCSWQLTSYQY